MFVMEIYRLLLLLLIILSRAQITSRNLAKRATFRATWVRLKESCELAHIHC